jgi:hypothetical protein
VLIRVGVQPAEDAGTFGTASAPGATRPASPSASVVATGSAKARPIPFGPFHLPVDSLGRTGVPFNTTLATVSAGGLRGILDAARDRGGRVLLAVSRRRSKDSFGMLSAAAVGEELTRWDTAVKLDDYIADGTVLGIYVTDEPNCKICWGGTRGTEEQVDSMAMLAKRLWPTVTTFARVEPTFFRKKPQYLDVAWAQYAGPQRDGPPEKFREEQVKAAKDRGLGLVLWMNTLDGGDGSSEIPGTFENAAKVRRWQMSASEVLRIGTIFLKEPYNCAALHWQWSPVFKAERPSEQLDWVRAFDSRPDIRAAMDSLGKLAAGQTRRACPR